MRWCLLPLIWTLSCSGQLCTAWWAPSYDISLYTPPSPCQVSPVLLTDLQLKSPTQPFPAGTQALHWTPDCLAALLTLCFSIPSHCSRTLGLLPVLHPGPPNPVAASALPAFRLLHPSFFLLPDRPMSLRSPPISPLNPPEFTYHPASSVCSFVTYGVTLGDFWVSSLPTLTSCVSKSANYKRSLHWHRTTEAGG